MVSSSANNPLRYGVAEDFTGKVAIVTGGGTGLGKGMASKLAAQGAHVVIASRKSENLDSTQKELAELGHTIHTCQTDVRDPDQVERLVSFTKEKFGRIDILINNAAGNFVVPSEKLSTNGWNAVVGIVLNGTWYCTSAAAKTMIEQRSGCILNIIATYAWTGAPGVVHSAAAKAGVLAMTKTLAAEWGHYGIRINAFAPGPFFTEGASKNLLFESEAAQQKITNKIPLGRFAQIDELADLAVFLCSERASFVNGDVLTADGGMSLGRSFLEHIS